jgi:uncharacterized protein (TIGR03000 family)
MFRIASSAMRTAVLAAALLALTAAPVFAARGGWGGYRGGWGGYRGGYYGGYRGGYYGSWGRGVGWGYPGYYGRGLSVGVGFYGSPYSYGGYGYDYPANVYSYDVPSVATYDVVPSVESRASFYPPADVAAPAAADAAAPATVDVRVPADAEVWFDGNATRQRGEMREFSSPPLTPGKEYHYDIRARWMDNGRPVEDTRRVSVRAGARTDVDFTRPEKP